MDETARRFFDQQLADYREMYRLSLEQRSCLEREDMGALEDAFARTHRLMERILLRQKGMADLDGSDPEVGRRREELRRVLVDLQEMRQFNQRLAERLLDETRKEIRRLGTGRRAMRGYRNAAVGESRLFDGVR